MPLASNPHNFREIIQPACCINCRFAGDEGEGPHCRHYERRMRDAEVSEEVDGLDVYWGTADNIEWYNTCDLHGLGEPACGDDTPELDLIRLECEAELKRAYVESKEIQR